MSIDEPAFQAFMTAVHEHGPTGLGYRKALEIYEAAKAVPSDNELVDLLCEIDGRIRSDGLEGHQYASLQKRIETAILAARGVI